MKASFTRTAQKLTIVAAVAGCLLVAASASATIVWTLNPTAKDAPAGTPTLSYTSQNVTITASGYDNTNNSSLRDGTPTQLYFKSVGPINGAFETGLGVVNTADHELQAGSSAARPFDFIQFDLTMPLSSGATNGMISVSSVQAGESFTLWGSNIAGTLGLQLGNTYGSSTDNTFVALPNFGLYKYYSIAAATGDVMPVALSVDIPAVPEMSALLPIVALLALLGAVEAKRRRGLRA
jgi:hypothetical protein